MNTDWRVVNHLRTAFQALRLLLSFGGTKRLKVDAASQRVARACIAFVSDHKCDA